MSLVLGVDGCRGGWIAVAVRDGDPSSAAAHVVLRFEDLLDDSADLIAVDMPMGLPDHVGPGGRAPEKLVRPLLGARQSSVFSVPSRAAVEAAADLDAPDAYLVTCEAAAATSEPPRKISKQCFHILRRIRALDALLRKAPSLRARLFEIHPEVAFWRMNGERSLDTAKKVKNRPHPPGLELRRGLLVTQGFAPAFLEHVPTGAGADDLLDAAAAAWIALRRAEGKARSFPADPPRDAHGIEIAIWA